MAKNAIARTDGAQLAVRLPYHPAIESDFGIDRMAWKALTEAIFPSAKTQEGVLLALTYCRARNLDVMKRPVHVVPIWNRELGHEVETVWPGIGELRTTAHRTRLYAGREDTVFGPECSGTWKFQGKKDKKPRDIEVHFPEWAQVTVHRMVDGEPRTFAGPKVYWLETYSTRGASDAPNTMWAKRPRGQLDKCAEAAALRAAFPEEIGEQYSSDEVGMLHGVEGFAAPATPAPEVPSAANLREKAAAAMASRSQEVAADSESEPEPAATPEPEAQTPARPVRLSKRRVADLEAYASQQGVAWQRVEEEYGGPLHGVDIEAADPAAVESEVRALIDAMAQQVAAS